MRVMVSMNHSAIRVELSQMIWMLFHRLNRDTAYRRPWYRLLFDRRRRSPRSLQARGDGLHTLFNSFDFLIFLRQLQLLIQLQLLRDRCLDDRVRLVVRDFFDHRSSRHVGLQMAHVKASVDPGHRRGRRRVRCRG